MASLQSSSLSYFNSNISSTKFKYLPSASSGKTIQFKTFRLRFCRNRSDSDSSEPIPRESPDAAPKLEPTPTDTAKLAFDRAKAYKKTIESSRSSRYNTNPDGDKDGSKAALEGSGALSASMKGTVDEANELKKNRWSSESSTSSGNELVKGNVRKKEELKVSNIDFMGLNFADEKYRRGLPTGLVPISDDFPDGDLPEVELIVGDTSKFDGSVTATKPGLTQKDDSDIYKPKVSTWGVFPRPSNISKTYGGGRTIRPGEVLETAEEKAAKEVRTRELLAAYKKKVGLSIDPKLKAECQKALEDGDLLMDVGKLKEALPYYEEVMDKLTFQIN